MVNLSTPNTYNQKVNIHLQKEVYILKFTSMVAEIFIAMFEKKVFILQKGIFWKIVSTQYLLSASNYLLQSKSFLFKSMHSNQCLKKVPILEKVFSKMILQNTYIKKKLFHCQSNCFMFKSICRSRNIKKWYFEH